MAKEDFCFTYYDGDAARDKAHMTRLCRGAYDDLISMQRKVGHMNLQAIKMVLSKDFDSCWASLEFILQVDNDGKFFIEWVDRSINKMKKHSLKQKENADKRWNKDATALPSHQFGITNDMPLENENGDECILGKEGTGEKPLYQPSILAENSGLKFPIEQCLLIALNDARWVKANKTNKNELLEFNAMLERGSIYDEVPLEYKRYFGNWKAKGKLDLVLKSQPEIPVQPGMGGLAIMKKLQADRNAKTGS